MKVYMHTQNIRLDKCIVENSIGNTDGESRDSIGKINLASQTKREKVPVLKKC